MPQKDLSPEKPPRTKLSINPYNYYRRRAGNISYCRQCKKEFTDEDIVVSKRDMRTHRRYHLECAKILLIV